MKPTKRQIRIAEHFVRKVLKEETWADAAREIGIIGEIDNELLGYMGDLYQAIENLNNYPLERAFPQNKSDVVKLKQGFQILLRNKFGQLFN